MRRLKPQHVIVCVNRFDGVDIWAVRYGFRWFVGRRVSVRIPLTTCWKGPAARQPRAYLQGRGVVRTRPGGQILVSAT